MGQHLARLWRYGLLLSRQRHVAEDLVQATCVRALERGGQFESGTRMDRWLMSILHSIWLNEVRAQKVRQGEGLSPADAVLAFDGDVYGGLDARNLPEADLQWLQDHLCILSGLYGVLRPLDWMQPYRLEMGTRLKTERGNNLYQFWGDRIARYLNERAAADRTPVVINLASEEYFKAVDRKALVPRVVSCVFEERKGDGYKVISFMAKRARGLMVRWAVTHRASQPEQLQGFDMEGYRHVPAASEPDRLVFRREAKA